VAAAGHYFDRAAKDHDQGQSRLTIEYVRIMPTREANRTATVHLVAPCRSPAWPWAHRQLNAGHGGQALTGDATPAYCASDQTAALVAKLLPAARFLMMLRDPVDRAYSEYQMKQRRIEAQVCRAFERLACGPSRGDQAGGSLWNWRIRTCAHAS
jgi:hypothetical protein